MKICFIPCIFTLLISCTNQQEAQPKSPPTKQTSPSSSSSNQSSQINEPEKPANNNSNSEQNNSEDSQRSVLIHEIVELAKVGTVKNCSFPADTTVFDQVTAKWGEPDKLDFSAGNRYATYTSRGIVFGINKGEQIFDVRSYSKELQQITFTNLKDELGAPTEVHTNSGDTIWVYNVSDKFQLKFVGSKATIDHISVYCPADAKNQMAG
jgi:hypothetical protein